MRATEVEYTLRDRMIFSIQDLSIHKGDRIGLVGRNGEGKTLLLEYLMGKLEEEPNTDWWVEASLMEQLPTGKENGLSGGEKTLQQLDRMFEERTPLVFLDEPTNNLDWRQIEKLEQKLVAEFSTYVIVSHDRAFLDRTCDKIWELEGGRLTSFDGNYTFYEETKKQQRLEKQKKYEQYVQEKKRLEERARKKNDQSKHMRKPPKRMGNSEARLGKNKAASKQKKVERVSKTLERRIDRLEKVEKPFDWSQVKMTHQHAQPVARRTIASLRDESVYAGEKKLFDIPHAVIPTGAKLALIGGNGTGKTTLIQYLMREKGWDDKMDVAYFHQDLASLPLEKTVYEYAGERSPLEESQVRTILGRLNFFEEDMNKRIQVLSGGERVKLAIARLLTRMAHLLVLDEPTNHLDLGAIEALETLMVEYPGTILFVSHDRTFVERIADRLWIIDQGQLTDFDGTLKEWQQPKPKKAEEYDAMVLESRLTEIVSRLSLPSPHEDKAELEQEYQEILRKLNERRK
ncbi:ribosomal protection-like ABC-F family protein [Halobacillus salinus]|uniref:ribosomal protection-like ABC-F family protein n=1 Tax=Halobacillus salinus TaxID=192814 RepID=UPI0020CA2E69|nr:ATP-binding cassette domain-containing protein [Halobacillus salinus]